MNKQLFLALFLICLMVQLSVPVQARQKSYSISAVLTNANNTALDPSEMASARKILVTIQTADGTPFEGTLMAAAYSGTGALVKILDEKPFSVSKAGTEPYALSFDVPDNNIERIAVYCWDSYDSMIPAIKSYNFYKTLFSVSPEEQFDIETDVVEPGDEEKLNDIDSPIRHFPFLASSGDTVIASFSQYTDTAVSNAYGGIRISRDGGETWPEKYVYPDFYFTSLLKRKSGDWFGISYSGYLADNKNITMHYWTSGDDGRTWVPHTGNVNVGENLVYGGVRASIVFHRTMMEMEDGSLQGTAYGKFTGDSKYRCIWIKSTDGGANWEVVSTIAMGVPVAADGSPENDVEGYCEPVTVRCADDSLLTIMRIASFKPLYQSRSTDNGLTWSTPRILPGVASPSDAQSVDPDACLLADGTLALSYGRLHVKLLLAPDGCGYQWQDRPTILYTHSEPASYTSGYSGVREITPGRLLVIGDKGASFHNLNAYGIWGRFVNVSRTLSPASDLSKVKIFMEKDFMSVGEENVRVDIKGFDQYGRLYPLDDCDIAFTTTEENAVSVAADGTVTAVSDAIVDIKAEILDNGKKITSDTLRLKAGDILRLDSITAAIQAPLIEMGQKTQVVFTPFNMRNTVLNFSGITASYESSNENIAAVNSIGEVTGVANGSATITVKAVKGGIEKTAAVAVQVRPSDTMAANSFEADTVAAAPNGFSVGPNSSKVYVTDTKAATGTKSVRLSDDVNNAMASLKMNDETLSTTRTIDFRFYPVKLADGLIVKIYPDNSYNQSGFMYNLVFSGDGSAKWYRTTTPVGWNELLPVGTVKLNEWNTVRIETKSTNQSVTITVNGVSGTVAGTRPSFGGTRGVEFHSGSTVGVNCDVYIDDVAIYRTPADGFESETPLANYSIIGNQEDVAVETETVYMGGQAVKITNSAGISQTSATEWVNKRVECKLNPSVLNGHVSLSLGNEQAALFEVGIFPDGAVKYDNGSEWIAIGAMELHKWSNVRVQGDASTGKLRVYIDGNLLSEGSCISGSGIYSLDTVSIRCNDGTLYADDFLSEDITLSENILVNPGFEEGTTGWRGFGTQLKTVTAERYSGNQAVDVIKYPGNPAGYVGQTVTVKPGYTYSASAWAKLGEGKARYLCIAVAFVDATGQRYVTIAGGTKEPGNWVELSGSITVPEGVHEMELYVQLYSATTDDGVMDQKFYVDDAKFSLVKN